MLGLLVGLLRLIFLGQTYLRSRGKGNLTPHPPTSPWPGPLSAALKNNPRLAGEPGSSYLPQQDLILPHLLRLAARPFMGATGQACGPMGGGQAVSFPAQSWEPAVASPSGKLGGAWGGGSSSQLFAQPVQ